MTTFGGELIVKQLKRDLDLKKGERLFEILISLTSHLPRNVILIDKQVIRVIEDTRSLGMLTLKQSSGFITSINHVPTYNENDLKLFLIKIFGGLT